MTENKLTPAQRRVLELLAKISPQEARLAKKTEMYADELYIHSGVAYRLRALGLVEIHWSRAYLTPAGREALGHD